MKAPLALTMGEPGGVGPELVAKAWDALRGGDTRFFLIADPALARATPAKVAVISSPGECAKVFSDALPVLPLQRPVEAAPGHAEAKNAAAVIESIERAVALAISGAAAGVVTNPIQKAALIKAGFQFPGHTEFLADLTKDAPMPAGRKRGPVMMIAGPALRSVPVTIHQSILEAVNALNGALIEQTCIVAGEALRHDFGLFRPRLAVSGLNPHAGEGGALGHEDLDIIAPAIARLRKAGLDVRGPLPADTMFHEEARGRYDAAVCMLHDQALIPAKTLGFHDAVNVTLGLPIVRTSPDHGTALDIAGTGAARADSLIAALHLAAEIAERRAAQ